MEPDFEIESTDPRLVRCLQEGPFQDGAVGGKFRRRMRLSMKCGGGGGIKPAVKSSSGGMRRLPN